MYVWVANPYRQNEYASILAKRVNEEKAKKTELRSKSILYLPGTILTVTDVQQQSGERRR